MRKFRRVFIFYQLRNHSLHATSRACVCAQLTRVTLTSDVMTQSAPQPPLID